MPNLFCFVINGYLVSYCLCMKKVEKVMKSLFNTHTDSHMHTYICPRTEDKNPISEVQCRGINVITRIL